jgi:dihydrolipoamide dehydrogenase
LNERGLPPVDRHTLQVGALRVFMPGDANTQVPLLHEAADDGHIAGMNALADVPARFHRRTALSIVFCDPQVATVGQALADLDAAATVTGTVDFTRQGRARAALYNQGSLRVHADRTTGRLRGAEVCAPHGEHLAHLLALAVQQELTVHDLLGLPFYHPTLEEGLRTALRDAARQLPDTGQSDLATCGALGVSALE